VRTSGKVGKSRLGPNARRGKPPVGNTKAASRRFSRPQGCQSMLNLPTIHHQLNPPVRQKFRGRTLGGAAGISHGKANTYGMPRPIRTEMSIVRRAG